MEKKTKMSGGPLRSATLAPRHSLLVSRGTMDFFQHRYYRTTKILLSFVGQWPYMTARTRCGFFAVAMLVNSVPTVTAIMTIVKYHKDWDIILPCILIISLGLFTSTKILISLCNSGLMLKLLNRIRADWHVWAGEREVNILHDYTEQGRKYVSAFSVLAGSVVFLYLTPPILTTIIDAVLHNDSACGQLPFPMHIYQLYGQQYYLYIMAYTSLTGLLATTISVSFDALLIGYMQHCFGIFAALGHKLDSFGKIEKTEITADTAYVPRQQNMTFEYTIFTCIERHNDAIKYAKLIEATYTWMFLLTMLLRLSIVCILGFQVVKGMHEPQETVQCVACGLGFTVYVYIESYLAQELIDHSVSIRYYVQNSPWYKMPLKAQKLLMMMLMRCNVPCQLTAGKMFNISVESFAVFLKTAISYLTVLRSM